MNSSIFVRNILSFYVILSLISIIDRKKNFKDSHIGILFGTYITGIITLNVLFNFENEYMSMLIMAILLCMYSFIFIKTKFGYKIFESSIKYLCFATWTPTVIFSVLEFFYLLNEKGFYIERYYTNICRALILFYITTLVIVFLLRNKKISFITFGCIGIISSLTITAYLTHGYELTYNYGFAYNSYSPFYEAGNNAVAADTIINAQIPIIDNFSAHALRDVWSRILYSAIHGDLTGILCDPYGGLNTFLSFVLLFYIVKKIFDDESALFMICLFPLNIWRMKILSVCFLPIVLLLNIIKKKNIKNYFLFWIFTLITAFMLYDEGIYIGIGCIVAYIIIEAIHKNWKDILIFIATGAGVGLVAGVFVIGYCIFNEISIITRIREWLALSLDSTTTWATEVFGDQTTLDFLIVYYILPLSAVGILIATIIKYFQTKENSNNAAMVLIFSIAQILYISRTIIFHNLTVALAGTNVVCNFAHWTISSFALYLATIKKENENKKLLIWTSTLAITIFVLSTQIYEYVPVAKETILLERAEKVSKYTQISNDMTSIFGKKRITYTEETSKFVNQFKNVFDTLLKEDESFLEFSNITAIYMLTNRERPFYVAQSPSLLTNLYSQECYLDEIRNYSLPLAVMGTTTQEYTMQMKEIPHNVRYYTIAEYIYKNYRPLVKIGDFAIWCENDKYDEFKEILKKQEFIKNGYELLDYGYDATEIIKDENGNIIQKNYKPYHQYNLKEIPYIWANLDEMNAIQNKVIEHINPETPNVYRFSGSKNINRDNGNYLAFKCNNIDQEEKILTVVFGDRENECAQFEYQFTVLPGENEYLIRTSQDYFWEAFNINNIVFDTISNITVSDVRILEGD